MWLLRLYNVKIRFWPCVVKTIVMACQYMTYYGNLNVVLKPAFYELARGALTLDAINQEVQNGRLTIDDLFMVRSVKNKLIKH